MKNIQEVIRAKEQEILRVQIEVEALRIVAPLLGEDDRSQGNGRAPCPQPIREEP